jgi:hypothetical protein
LIGNNSRRDSVIGLGTNATSQHVRFAVAIVELADIEQAAPSKLDL